MTETPKLAPKLPAKYRPMIRKHICDTCTLPLSCDKRKQCGIRDELMKVKAQRFAIGTPVEELVKK